MIENPQSEMVVVTPDKMRVCELFGDRVTFYLTGGETGGKCAAFLIETPPGGGPPPHLHHREDEWFLVLEGRVEFFREGEWFEVPVGSSVFAPKGSVHAYRNVGDTMLRQIIHATPSGLEEFFAAMSEEWQREGGVDMERVVRRSSDFGIEYPLLDAE